MQIMEYDYFNIFPAPGTTEELSADLILKLEGFVCKMYGSSQQSVTLCRFEICQKSFKPRDNENPFQKLKGCGASHYPPCKAVLLQKIKEQITVSVFHVTL